MTARFSGKVALIAGGTGGLGRAVSSAFLDEGAKVLVTYRNPKEFDALRRVAPANASALRGETVDVTDEVAMQQLVQKVIAEHKQLDIVVNAVGGYAAGTPLWELDAKLLEQMLALNLWSGYAIARAVVPVMLKQKHGVIINVASKAAVDHAAGPLLMWLRKRPPWR